MSRTCQRCGAPLPPEARFCPRCGMPVADEGQGEERKLVSVLFADLADSTTLANRLDPERLREVMAAFYAEATDEVASLRGRTEKFVGDAVMAVFGVPHAHDDDAIRAVRAGLGIRDRVDRLGSRLGLPVSLEVRVGVNTGPVVVGAGDAAEFLVSGPAVNLAARLQEAARPGEVLVGDTTWQLTREEAEFGPHRRVEAKGFDGDVEACPVERLSARSSRRTIPLVDRRRELDLLVGAFERASEARRAHLVTLVGEPGIGKSRLVQELMAALPEGTELMVGRASEFGEDVSFASLVDMVRRRLAVEGEGSPEVLRERLDEVVRGCCDPSQAERVTAQLGLLLGLGDEARQGSPYRSAEIRSGLLTFLEGLARTGPVVLVFEDLHLARPALLEVIEEVLREGRRLPLLVVAVAREWLLRARPEWAAGLSDSFVVRLETLSTEESRELAAAAGEGLDQATTDRVAGMAGGNPYFIVETTGMLLHESDRHTHGTPPRGLLPPTVQAVVASRIDHVDEPARTLLRVASIFPGGAFHESKLALVARPDPEALATLEDEELILRDEERQGRWLFRHHLLRDVAYDSLAKRERRRLHEAVAEGLDELEASEQHAQQVAYHLEEAARAALDLDPTDRGPARRAEAALRRAGDLSRWRVESRSAIDLYERALRMAGGEAEWGPDEARILAGIGEARYWLGEYDDAEATLALALEKAGADAWSRALAGRFLADIVLNIHGEPERAERMFREALDASREIEAPWAIARTLLMAGWVPYWKRDHSRARAMFEEALRIARGNPAGDWWAEARALNSLCSVVAPVGDATEGLALAERALAIGREHGDPFTIAGSQENVASAYRRMFRLDEALEAAEEAVRLYRELRAPWELASAVGDRGTIHRLAGRLDAAEADLREALHLCLDLGERALVSWTLGELVETILLRGDLEAAREVMERTTLPSGPRGPAPELEPLTAASLLAHAEGDEARARELARRALDAERGGGLPNWEASSTWFLGSVYGADLVGGEDAMEAARARLESAHWVQALREPDLVKA